jgi:N-acetyl-1-D-myo-inositol-2-amino-2-deoxy-alpha-D-glucopyranoside deacetylase
MRGVELAADPDFGRGEPWQVAKIYWNAIPETVLRDGIRAIREAGDQTFFEGMDPDTDEMPSFVLPDDLVTTRIDGMDLVEAKMAAMRAHATQITVDGPFFALSNNLGNRVWGVEYYRLVRGELGTERDAEDREVDLFAGIQ